MNSDYLFSFLFGVLAYFAHGFVAHEAIIGGKVTELKPFRYMVSLYEVGYGHVCGGAIIDKKSILTAAHCFVNPDNTFKSRSVFAITGTNDLEKLHVPAANIEAVRIYIPFEYNASDPSTTGDLAVLKLRDPLPIAYADNLKSVKLEKNQKSDHTGQKAKITGWGTHKIDNHDGTNQTDSLLRCATANVLSHHQCQQEHPTLEITNKHLCAKVEQHEHETRGVCYADDGGPLVHDGFVIGVLSKYLKSCSERTSAAIYTSVSHYLTFIKNAKANIENRNMLSHRLGS